MTTTLSSASAARPKPILYAVVLTAINAIGGVLFTSLMPDLDDRGTIVVVSVVAAVLMLASAAWLWLGSRWGAYALIALNVLNIVAALPAYFEADGEFMVGATVSIALSLLTIWFVWTAEARAFWRGS